MNKNKNKKGAFSPKYAIIILAVALIIVFGFAQTGSLISNSGLETSLSMTDESSQGVQFSMSGVSDSNYGADRNLGKFSGTQIFTGSLNHDPSSASNYPIVSNIEGEFPFSDETQFTTSISASYLMWVRSSSSSGDWSKWVGGSTNNGYANCRPINKGNPILPSQRVEYADDFYSGLNCDFFLNITCPGFECDMKSLSNVGVNVYIPKTTTQIVVIEETQEIIPETESLQEDVPDVQQNSEITQSTKNLTLVQKINLWISNLFSKLFGGQK